MLGQVQLRKEIAIRLKQARKNIGFDSAEAFCQQTGLSMDGYPRHEDGSIALQASQAIQYSKLLHVSLHWLMFGETQLKPHQRYKRRANPKKPDASKKKTASRLKS